MNKEQINRIREEFDKKFGNLIKYHVQPDNTGGMLVENIKYFILQKLSEQRQSILEEIEKLSKELETIDIRDILKKLK